MKLKDLPEGTVIDNIRIKLPEDMLKAFRDFAGVEPIMYFAGSGFGGDWMSPDPPGGKRRLYPFPECISTCEVLNWEIDE